MPALIQSDPLARSAVPAGRRLRPTGRTALAMEPVRSVRHAVAGAGLRLDQEGERRACEARDRDVRPARQTALEPRPRRDLESAPCRSPHLYPKPPRLRHRKSSPGRQPPHQWPGIARRVLSQAATASSSPSWHPATVPGSCAIHCCRCTHRGRFGLHDRVVRLLRRRAIRPIVRLRGGAPDAGLRGDGRSSGTPVAWRGVMCWKPSRGGRHERLQGN